MITNQLYVIIPNLPNEFLALFQFHVAALNFKLRNHLLVFVFLSHV
jgi:hypothetical protein